MSALIDHRRDVEDFDPQGDVSCQHTPDAWVDFWDAQQACRFTRDQSYQMARDLEAHGFLCCVDSVFIHDEAGAAK